MAIIKCKMCGGDLQIIEGSSVCECEYCGTKQTVPNADNEKKMTLFSRALRLLRNCEFDKASGVFETIVADFPEEAEAYWGLVLCKYGIEYVDDPGTGKKVPTCHRSSFESVLDDQNFEQACENADAIARRVYRDEARQIEELRKGIIEVSGKEDPYDIFISYKETDENGDRTLDSVIAQDIYNELTEKGYRVFFSRISLESKLGTEYEPYIFAALNSAKVMIVVGTDYENFDAVWVKNEWSRFLKLIASGQKKTLIPVFKNMDAYDMPKEFAKLSAQDMGKVGALQDLLYGVEKLLGKKGPAAPESTGAYADSGMTVMNAQTAAMLKRGYMMLSDGAYTKADELFEKVLNNDAECGQAYWGKALAAANVSDASQFGAVAAFNCLKSDDMFETITLPLDLVAAARSADETGLLESFSDQELEALLEDLKKEPVQYQTAKQFYKNQKKQYLDIDALHELVHNRDYDRAKQFADKAVQEAEQMVLKSFQARLEEAVEEEKKKEITAREKLDGLRFQVISTIQDRLSKPIQEQNQLRQEIEDARHEAEMRSERDYREALAKFEENYQASLIAYEEAYQSELAVWQQKKEAFELGHDAAVEEHMRLSEKIGQLTTERNNLTGLFVGKKRRELDEQISDLQRKKKETIIPEDPGPKPIKLPAPEKGEPPKKENFKVIPTTGAAADLREQVQRCLSPAYRKYKESLEKLKYAKKGEEVVFGRYASKADGTAEPITWKVLEKEGERILVISKFGLDARQYNGQQVDITWEKCGLRSWLNEVFLKKAFNDLEQKMIPTVLVKAENNPKYPMNPGRDTMDKVFLLSINEADKYFSSGGNRSRLCKPTAYAKIERVHTKETGNCRWWLRTPGIYQYTAACIDYDGENTGCSMKVAEGYYRPSVRPALWINLES